MKVIAYLHTHWDREWYRTFEEFRFRFVEVFDDIVKKLLDGEFSQFYLDGQTVLLEDLLEICPGKIELIKSLVKSKKLVLGPWYTLADEFLVSGESLIRNLFIGMMDSKKLGVEDFTGYLPDAFGHTQSMPQILNSFDIKNAVLWRGAGHKPSEFVWKSKDGSQVYCTHLVEGYFQDYFSSNNLAGVVDVVSKIKKRNFGDIILLPIGADHLGVVNHLPDKVKTLKKEFGLSVEVGSIFDYLKLVPSKFKTENKELHCGELRDNSCNFILPGTYSTRNYLKRQNAYISWELKKVEAFLSLCQQNNILSSKKDFLDYIWRLHLKNHAHDSICGCSIDAVHKEMELRNENIMRLLCTLKDRAVVSLEEDNKDELFIFNSSSFEYSGKVELQTTKELFERDGFYLKNKSLAFSPKVLQDIHKVPVAEDMQELYTYEAFVENVPALNFSTINPSLREDVSTDLSCDESSIENEFIKVLIKDDGLISIFDKFKGVEYEGMHILESRVDLGDSYNFSPDLNEEPLQAKFLDAKYNTSNFETSVQLQYELKDDIITTNIVLESKSPILKFKTQWQNIQENYLLQVKFLLKNKITKTISEDALGSIEREFDAEYDILKQPSVKGFEELKTNTAPMQRFVWTQGVGLLSKGLHEYEVCNNELKLTLLRSVGMLSKTNMHTRSIYAGPPLEIPEAQCQRDLCCEYALSFSDSKDMFQLADKYYNPTLACLSSKRLSEYTFSNPNIYLLAMKEANSKKGIVFRLLNLSSKSQKLSLRALELNSLEETLKEESSLCDEHFFEPFELKTLVLI